MDFTEKLRLRGKAEEDRFFAELDRQLIEAMHEKQKRDDEHDGENESVISQHAQEK
ncbi:MULTISPECIES: hypothetical protein [Vibrio]|uniref:hypothetical protein n=1 Tax=Vibrio TaxID=662 RepID=UPI001AFC9EF0|nr:MULTISPECIES: hypothetical protein [Vibrio]BBM67291.1 hypothetical protein VA249_39370 [Vibrio alfacsensis]BCN26655.1 hypothetical protein VYA_38470 [Vibrio alfacsensis]CAE6938848.1 hypothetical protein ACOMICROBIO_GDFFDHBD_03075 [Vibrio sp. B1REV9]